VEGKEKQPDEERRAAHFSLSLHLLFYQVGHNYYATFGKVFSLLFSVGF
jgi:hypothetical protein